MGGVQKVLEVLHGAKLRIHFFVVRYGIVGTQGSLAAFRANLIHGHEPEDVYAQVLEAGQLGFHALEGTFLRELADVHFIDHGAVGPFGMILRCFGGASGQSQRCAKGKKDSFHMLGHWFYVNHTIIRIFGRKHKGVPLFPDQWHNPGDEIWQMQQNGLSLHLVS